MPCGIDPIQCSSAQSVLLPGLPARPVAEATTFRIVTSHWRFGEPLKTTLKFLRCYVGVPTAKNEAVLVAADSWYAPTDAWELY